MGSRSLASAYTYVPIFVRTTSASRSRHTLRLRCPLRVTGESRIAPNPARKLLFGVVAMLIFYALEDRSPWYILAFAAACGLGSAYGFLQGAWPFGVSRRFGPSSPLADTKFHLGLHPGIGKYTIAQ
jgi:hypothetical protein